MVALSTSACVSVDSRALRATPPANSNAIVQGIFINSASYRSRGELVGAATLAEALHIAGREAEYVQVSVESSNTLNVRLFKHGKPILEKKYTSGSAFELHPDGSALINLDAECRGKDSPGFGCGWGTVRLFLDQDDNLNVVQSGAGAGVIGIIPIALYAKHLSVFRRVSQVWAPTVP
ncbi:MAG: hypothetical protein ACREMY_10370 [bacterium]